jgi:hypothetical protein
MSQGRRIETDDRVVYDLAFLGASNRQIAAVHDCHHSAFTRRSDVQRIIAEARSDRAKAIVVLWEQHAPGALRSANRPSELTALVRAAEQRRIERRKPH